MVVLEQGQLSEHLVRQLRDIVSTELAARHLGQMFGQLPTILRLRQFELAAQRLRSTFIVDRSPSYLLKRLQRIILQRASSTSNNVLRALTDQALTRFNSSLLSDRTEAERHIRQRVDRHLQAKVSDTTEQTATEAFLLLPAKHLQGL